MLIRPYQTSDNDALIAIFYAAVHQIDEQYYSKKEKMAWAPVPPDYTFWYRRLNQKQPFVAVINTMIVGFIELDPDGHIDCLYVHPDYQRCGVAMTLYQALEKSAYQQKIQRLFVEASLLAKPFFDKNGFQVLSQNQASRQDCLLTYYCMEKILISHE